MAGDHHYEAPKTDGTFGLKVDWSKLSKSKIPASSQAKPMPFKPLQPVTMQELQTKTLKEWWNWRNWRQVSPLQQFSFSGNFANYRAKHFSGKLPSSQFMAHFVVVLVAYGCLTNYPKNVNHMYAKHH